MHADQLCTERLTSQLGIACLFCSVSFWVLSLPAKEFIRSMCFSMGYLYKPRCLCCISVSVVAAGQFHCVMKAN